MCRAFREKKNPTSNLEAGQSFLEKYLRDLLANLSFYKLR